jgi:hypothetical protein
MLSVSDFRTFSASHILERPGSAGGQRLAIWIIVFRAKLAEETMFAQGAEQLPEELLPTLQQLTG